MQFLLRRFNQLESRGIAGLERENLVRADDRLREVLRRERGPALPEQVLDLAPAQLRLLGGVDLREQRRRRRVLRRQVQSVQHGPARLVERLRRQETPRLGQLRRHSLLYLLGPQGGFGLFDSDPDRRIVFEQIAGAAERRYAFLEALLAQQPEPFAA